MEEIYAIVYCRKGRAHPIGGAFGEDFFQTIKCPVLVMAGDRDPGNPPQRVVSIAQMIPQSQIAIIPNSTHGVFLENFDAVSECIIPFLKSK